MLNYCFVKEKESSSCWSLITVLLWFPSHLKFISHWCLQLIELTMLKLWLPYPYCFKCLVSSESELQIAYSWPLHSSLCSLCSVLLLLFFFLAKETTLNVILLHIYFFILWKLIMPNFTTHSVFANLQVAVLQRSYSRLQHRGHLLPSWTMVEKCWSESPFLSDWHKCKNPV